MVSLTTSWERYQERSLASAAQQAALASAAQQAALASAAKQAALASAAKQAALASAAEQAALASAAQQAALLLEGALCPKCRDVFFQRGRGRFSSPPQFLLKYGEAG